jgi:urease accessory protein UreE
MKRVSSVAATILLLAGVVGCGSYPPPTERMMTAEAAIRGAQEVNASQQPRAALHLKLAQEETDKARREMEDGYNEEAELTLRRAQADAELAIAISKEQDTVAKAQAAQQRLEQAKAASRRTK